MYGMRTSPGNTDRVQVAPPMRNNPMQFLYEKSHINRDELAKLDSQIYNMEYAH